ncbi:MAG: inositol monophosphatase, partial [Pusillimonas sp.]
HQQDPWPIGGRVVAGNRAIERALHEMIAPHLDKKG